MHPRDCPSGLSSEGRSPFQSLNDQTIPPSQSMRLQHVEPLQVEPRLGLLRERIAVPVPVLRLDFGSESSRRTSG